MFEQKLNLMYSDSIDNNKYNVMYVPDSFIQALESQKEIVVEGGDQTQVVFNSEHQSFKMLEIKYLNTLIVNDRGQIVREGNNYLKVELRKPETQLIFEALKEKQLQLAQLVNQNLETLVQQKGTSMDQISKRFKISPKEFRQFAQKAHYIQCQGKFLFVSRKTYNQIFHALLNYLTSNSLSVQNISIQDIHKGVYPHNEIDIVIFSKAVSIYLQPTGQNGTFRITLTNVIRYILSEMGEVKQEYLKKEFDQVFHEMVQLYTPANMNLPQEFPQIPDCFIYVKQHDQMYYYQTLGLPTTVKELIARMAAIKKKFTLGQIKGLMGHLFPDRQLQEALIKYFRKFTSLYEIKALSVLA